MTKIDAGLTTSLPASDPGSIAVLGSKSKTLGPSLFMFDLTGYSFKQRRRRQQRRRRRRLIRNFFSLTLKQFQNSAAHLYKNCKKILKKEFNKRKF